MNVGLDVIALTTPRDALISLGSWIRTERQRANWTQGDLARRSGVPAASISRLERTGLASTDSLFRIVFALDRLEVFQDFLKERLRMASIPTSLETMSPPRARHPARAQEKGGRMTLSVFLRFSGEAKLKVGTLFEIGRDTAFEYDRAFLATGLNIAPFRLPPKPGVQIYDRSGNMETFGVFEDSLPDGWGRQQSRSSALHAPLNFGLAASKIWPGNRGRHGARLRIAARGGKPDALR